MFPIHLSNFHYQIVVIGIESIIPKYASQIKKRPYNSPFNSFFEINFKRVISNSIPSSPAVLGEIAYMRAV